MLADRAGEPVGAEDEPQPLGLADERRLARRVVQQRDPHAARRRSRAGRLERRRRRASSRRTPRGRAARRSSPTALPKPPTKPFTPAMPTLDAARPAGSCASARARRRPPRRARATRSAGAVGVPVVVAEHRDDRDREVAAGVGDDADLVDLPVLRQVAGEQHEVGLLLDARERLAHAVAVAGPAWMSPAAATRIVFAMPSSYPRIGTAMRGYRIVPWPSDDDLRRILLDAMKQRRGARSATTELAVRARGRARRLRARRPRDRPRRRLRAQAARTPSRRSRCSARPASARERPPEGWLYKVFDDSDAMIDLIFAPNSRPRSSTRSSSAPTSSRSTRSRCR